MSTLDTLPDDILRLILADGGLHPSLGGREPASPRSIQSNVRICDCNRQKDSVSLARAVTDRQMLHQFDARGDETS